MKNFACFIGIMILCSAAPIGDMVFGLDTSVLMGFYWGAAFGIPYGVLAYKTDLENRREAKTKPYPQ